MRILKFEDDPQTMTISFTVQMDHYEYPGFKLQEFDPNYVIDKVKQTFNPRAIQEIIYNYFDLPVTLQEKMKDAEEMGRFGRLVRIRRLCYYFLRTYTDLTMEKLGELYGQDHSTVTYHVSKVKDQIEMEYPDVIDDIKCIDAAIKHQLNHEK